MRRHVCCLLLLLPVATTQAADVPALRHDGTACTPSAHGTETTATPAPSRSRTRSPALPGSDGDDEPLLPRPRLPRWHSFLPGMFR